MCGSGAHRVWLWLQGWVALFTLHFTTAAVLFFCYSLRKVEIKILKVKTILNFLILLFTFSIISPQIQGVLSLILFLSHVRGNFVILQIKVSIGFTPFSFLLDLSQSSSQLGFVIFTFLFGHLGPSNLMCRQKWAFGLNPTTLPITQNEYLEASMIIHSFVWLKV